MSRDTAKAFYDPSFQGDTGYITADDGKGAIDVIYDDMDNKISTSGGFVTGDINRSGAAGTSRLLLFSTNAVSRWSMGATNSSESGNNTGSHFTVARWNDAGAWIDNPLSISRTDGKVTVTNGLWIGTGAFIENLTEPTSSKHATTKNYVDTTRLSKVANDSTPHQLTARTFTSSYDGDYGPRLNINASSGEGVALTLVSGEARLVRNIAGSGISTTLKTLAVGEPTLNSHAATKYYADTKADSKVVNATGSSTTVAPSQSAVASALSGKSDTSHGHAISGITNLQTTLNSKATVHIGAQPSSPSVGDIWIS